MTEPRPLPSRVSTALGRTSAPAVILLSLAVALTPLAWGQSVPIPDRYTTTESDVDYPGGDLMSLFDITLEQCHATCLRLDGCVGFTYNTRNGSCFAKDSLEQPVGFDGAISGVISLQPPATLARASQVAQTLSFLYASDLSEAREQAITMAERYVADGRSQRELLDAARRESPAGAIQRTGQAVTVADDGMAWLAHARAYRDAAQHDSDAAYDLNRQAVPAAINAALRLNDDERAPALVVLAQALEATYRGQAALGALRAADALQPGIAADDRVRLHERFGFRLLRHDVESDTATPRICMRFSEDLVPAHDYAPYVQRDAQGLAIETEGSQLCVTGIEYGDTYRLTLRAGMPSVSGDALLADVPLELYVRDRAPVVRFPGRAYVLPAVGPRALPVQTVNADTLDLRLLRVSDRNLALAISQGTFAQALSRWEGEEFEEELAELVWEGEARLDGTLNQATTARLPLTEVGDLEPGVYVLRAIVPDVDPWEAAPATQWFLISDLGVTTLAGNDGLHVVAQRLSDGRPAEGMNVSLIARSNRVLAEARSDEQGHVVFPPALTLGTGAAAPAMVLVEGSDDLAVLSLEEPEFDLSDRGVTGRAPPGPVDLFLTSDRGVYRPGETVHVTALARDPQARAVPELPITLRLLRPDGVESARFRSNADLAGGHVIDVPLAAHAPRGIWRIQAYADPDAPALASQTVLVEDFVPERIDFGLSLDADGPIDVRSPPDLRIDARHAFGPPAAGLALTGSVVVNATPQLSGWPGYRFGRHDQRVDTQRTPLPAGRTTDTGGQLVTTLPTNELNLDPRPYELTVNATLVDGSSRPVERTLTRPLRPTQPVVGIRPGFDEALPENAEATFDLVRVAPDGTALGGDLTWQVDHVVTRYQWFSQGGNWYWEPVTERRRVAEGVATASDGPVSIAVPVAWGRHELRVTHEADPYASASLEFTAGWYAADTSRDTPEVLTLSLDAESYAPGDVARLRIVPDDAAQAADSGGTGMAIVSVLTDRVVDLRLVPIDGETTVDLPVTDDWGAGAYVTASLIRPSDGPEHMPARSLGLAHASVAPGDRALDAVLNAPREADPRERLEVEVEVPGLPDGPAYATVAAIDLGALTLTGFQPPDPSAHYFGQRRLGVAIRDLYGRLIDARSGAMGTVRSGGGLESDAAIPTEPLPAEDVLALFSGPVQLVNGRATVGFDLPAFNGTVRVMAVVWTDRAVGQAHADVLVRDPVVVQPSLPRFMTPGDQSRLRIELTHASGPAGQMRLSVQGHGLGQVPTSVTLGEGDREVLDLPLRPTRPGDHTYKIQLTTPGGRILTREVRLTVQHTDPETATSSQLTLAPGQTFRLDDKALAGYRDGTARATLAVGASTALDLPGLVQRLVGYPYGCTEQIASTLQPLLYAPDRVAQLGLVPDREIAERIQAGVDRMLSRQARTGAFGLWSAGGTSDLWLDAYATDVLLHAEETGAVLPDHALPQALANLRTELAQAGTMSDGRAPAYAYAIYVLARAGQAAIGDLRYYADVQAARFDTPLAAAHLAAALAAYGERTRAEAMFAQAQDLALTEPVDTGWRADYGTVLRDRAGLLALAAEAGSDVVDRQRLATLIADRPPVQHLSTQEAAWSLRAAARLGAAGQGLVVDGRPVDGDVVHLYDGAPVRVRNDGTAEVTVTLTTFGVPEDPPEAGGVAYTIARSHYAMDGQPADLSALRVGDRVVVVLEIRPDRGVDGGRLMIDDALPAGLEIDNANLLRAGDVSALDWLLVHEESVATEARADRFLAAVDWTSPGPLRLAYVARAVSPGDFHLPAPAVEDMYRPTHRAIGTTGRLTIRP